jgi:hypothetical protein
LKTATGRRKIVVEGLKRIRILLDSENTLPSCLHKPKAKAATAGKDVDKCKRLWSVLVRSNSQFILVHQSLDR